MFYITYKQGRYNRSLWLETNNKASEVLDLLESLYTDVKTHIRGLR